MIIVVFEPMLRSIPEFEGDGVTHTSVIFGFGIVVDEVGLRYGHCGCPLKVGKNPRTLIFFLRLRSNEDEFI